MSFIGAVINQLINPILIDESIEENIVIESEVNGEIGINNPNLVDPKILY